MKRRFKGRRKHEQRLSRLNAELAANNLRLQAANEALRDADRLKTEFLSAMSHELRTPLTSIIGFGETVLLGLAGPLNEEQAKQLGMAHGSARHLLALIDDLLEVVRIESGRADLRVERFDLLEIVREVCADALPAAECTRLGLRWPEGGPPMPVDSDRGKVRRILLNLLDNAIKFSARGEITVECSREGAEWAVAVTNQGVGIRPEHLPALFPAFRPVDGSPRRAHEGAGLGLYLSHKLAGLLGGSLRVESRCGQGSCFRFHLPAAVEPSP